VLSDCPAPHKLSSACFRRQELKAFNSKLQVLHSMLLEKVKETPEHVKPHLLDAFRKWARCVAMDPLNANASGSSSGHNASQDFANSRTFAI
jgi:hypothetical protein